MNDEQEQRLARFRALLATGRIDQDDFDAAMRGIGGRSDYQATAREGSTIAQGPGATAVAPGGVNIPGTVQGSVYVGEPTDDPAEALRIYRQVLLGRSANLPLRGVDVGASDPATAKQLGLANVYIDLDTTAQETVDVRDGEVRPKPGGQLAYEIRDLPDSRMTPPEKPDHVIYPLPALKAAILCRCLLYTSRCV